jgi:arylsulfatase A-like enzyme
LLLGSVLAAALLSAPASVSATRPNLLWIYIDDQSPWYSSYGDKTVDTPNIDRLVAEGVLFERAYAPTPVCSPTRSGIITGSYPIRIGAHDHRSGRVPEYQISLPEGVVTLPELFRMAGYETYNGTKDDFNFSYRRSDLYSIGSDDTPADGSSKSKPTSGAAGASNQQPAKQAPALVRGDQSWKGPSGAGHWTDVPPGRPFFGQMAVAGGKGTGTLTGQLQALGIDPVEPSSVRVPAQYPDIPQVRRHIATHYNAILRTDDQVGRLVKRLKADGRWDDTVLFLFSDHGSDLPRSKEFVYEEGLHVPLIVVAPGLADVVTPGTRRGDIVDLLDVAATSLALTGQPIPDFMDARNLFQPDYHRDYVFASADRMSNVIDRVRSVMGERYHYIRNFMLDRPLYNWGHREMIALAYPEQSSFLSIRALAEDGALTPAQAAPYGTRVAEELYDLETDPDEVINLAQDAAYAEVLGEMRRALDSWIEDTDDKGQYPRTKAAMAEITGRYPKSWLRSPEFRDP